MSKKDLNVVLIQSEIFWEDIDKNLIHFSELLSDVLEPADIVVLPEMFNTGFTTNTQKCAETMEGPTMEFLRYWAGKLNSIVIGSLLIVEGSHFYNRLVCMFPDGIYRTYDKRHLFRLSEEYKVMSSGDDRIIIQKGDWKILPLVCYDLRFPVWSRNTFHNGKYEYDLLVYPSNWPRSRAHVWKSLLVARAIENQAYVIGVNRIGADGFGTGHSGNSIIVDPKGIILADAGEKEILLSVKLSLNELDLFRESFMIGLDWDLFKIEY
ncbi:MAG: nitrilase-related carbon-nitrogen hydrolase [Bacteroidales bacterium]|jgi:predicted amidohydrolase